jgi:CPA1 family monovalent cation:H+ antiporter
LVALRADGTIGNAAFRRLEEELDWTELGWAQVVRSEQSGEGEL